MPTEREARRERSAIRARVAAMATVSKSAAKKDRAFPITRSYRTKQLRQCQALLNTVADFRPEQIRLVKLAPGEIEIWRVPKENSPAVEN